MKCFEVFSKASGNMVYRYSSPTDEPIEWLYFEFAFYDHIPVTEPVVIYQPIEPGCRILSPRAFRDRFTESEKNAIDRFEDTYLGDGLPDDVEDRIRTGLKDYHASQEIDLDDNRVPMLLGVFAGFGCIAPERIDEVIAG